MRHTLLYILLPVLVLLSVILTCCDRAEDQRLLRVERIVNDSLESATALFESINPDSLSERDRYLHDFLSVKIADKNYVTHTSDSLILRVIDHEESHKGDGRYAEALYYGGRVYSDLGDYPTFLKYFQQSLELLPEDTDNLRLRSTVLSQTGSLLESLRLFNEAIPYIQSSLDISRRLGDSVNAIYDLQLLGAVYLRAEQFEEAEKYLEESIAEMSGSNAQLLPISKMYLAQVKYRKGEIDSALNLIRDTPDNVSDECRNYALITASKVYLAAEKYDSAFIYAKELISSDMQMNKTDGYHFLLSELNDRLDTDSLLQYVLNYRDFIESTYDENEAQLTINQQNLYNYQLHDQARQKAEQHNIRLHYWIGGCVFVIMAMGIALLSFKNREQKHIMDHQKALRNIEKLKRELSIIKDSVQEDNVWKDTSPEITDDTELDMEEDIPEDTESDTLKGLRVQLRKELRDLYEQSTHHKTVSPTILQSEAYKSLQDLISAKKIIKDKNKLWVELERVVLESSPKFKENLNLLTLGKLNVADFQTALLIKCGIKPVEMEILLGRTHGALVSRRQTLGLKVFDEKTSIKIIDGIIRLL